MSAEVTGSFWGYHQFSIVAFVLCLMVIALSNWCVLAQARRRARAFVLRAAANKAGGPRVSILVPARDEEANIAPCVRSLLSQDYPDFEVIVLDDHSADRTGAILAELAAEQPGLQVLAGQALPPGWLGKHWACRQLREAATGELLLFTDADTRHRPQSVRHGVSALLAEQADLLTAFPRQEVVTWAERLVVPFFPWAILSFLPLLLAYRVAAPGLCAANGQYMLFRGDAYDAVGGHAAVRTDAVDDIALGRRIKAQGLRWRMALATGEVTCRMYRSARQVFEGFTKNLFAGFGYRIVPFVLVWLWIAIVFLQPPIMLVLAAAGVVQSAYSAAMAAAGVLAGTLLWGIAHARFGFPLYLSLLYPVTVAHALAIAVKSLTAAIRGKSTWKGRGLERARVKWL